MKRKDPTEISVTNLVRLTNPSSGLRIWNRFRTRLLAWLIVLSVATSVVAGYVFYRQQVGFVRMEQERRGHTLINNLAGQSELGAYSRDRSFLAGPCRRAFLEPDVAFVAIYGPEGEELLQLRKPAVRAPDKLKGGLLRMLLSDSLGHPRQRPSPDHIDFLAPVISGQQNAEQSLFGEGSAVPQVIGVARIGLSRDPARKKLNEVLAAGIRISLIILGMGALVALFLARRISRPILALARGADKIRSGGLGYQLDVRRRDELGLLASSFNRMSAQLRDTVDSLNHLNRNLEVEVNRRTTALRRSRDFLTMLNVPLQLTKLLDTALDALVRSTQAVAGAIFLLDRDDPELAVSTGAPAMDFEPRGVLLEFLREACNSHQPIVRNNIPSAMRLAHSCDEGRALLYVGLDYRQHIHGVLLLVLSANAQQDQIAFVENAASQLAIAVSNARAYANAEHLAGELEQRNVALLQQRDQLKEVSRLKSEFLAGVSHELRTPLNAVLGYTELISDGIYGATNDSQDQALTGITESATSLLSLINQILDLSKVEAGRVAINFEDVDLATLIRDVVEASASLVKDRPYDIAMDLPTKPVRVATDQTKVRQIVVNLLANAIKFTAEGSVCVQLRDGGEMPTTGSMHVDRLPKVKHNAAAIAVIDTGIGIKKSDLQLIFDEFRQVDGSFTREHGGTGLGLAISKKLSALIGGSITVESVHGEGSTFTLHIPLDEPTDGGGDQGRAP